MTSECGAGVSGEPVAVEVPPEHRAALRVLTERLTATDIVWALTGSTSFALQGVTVSVHDIDVQTDAASACRIAELFPQALLRPVAFAGTERIQCRADGSPMRVAAFPEPYQPSTFVPSSVVSGVGETWRTRSSRWATPAPWRRSSMQAQLWRGCTCSTPSRCAGPPSSACAPTIERSS